MQEANSLRIPTFYMKYLGTMKVLHLTTCASRNAGGLFNSVRRLTFETRQNGIDVRVGAVRDSETLADSGAWAPVPLSTFPGLGPHGFRYSPGLWNWVKESHAEALHLHGLWQFTAFVANRWQRSTGRPLVVSPHGMLEPWALQQSRWKKRLAGLAFQSECLHRAACIRATSEMEAESIRSAGCRNPIILIPNGVAIPRSLPDKPSREDRTRTALFLSRIHPKKGLPELLHAWRKASDCDPKTVSGWQLLIVGPDEGGHLAEVLRLADQLGLGKAVRYGGSVWNEEERALLYRSADFFVLPTFSENFGMVIAEALASGTPVVTTVGAPWRELESHGCGQWIPFGIEPLTESLLSLMRADDTERALMGKRGQDLVSRRYGWASVGLKMAETYRWLFGGDRPEFVLGS